MTERAFLFASSAWNEGRAVNVNGVCGVAGEREVEGRRINLGNADLMLFKEIGDVFDDLGELLVGFGCWGGEG